MFNERKAAEAAAHLLRMAPGHRMPYISLIKFLYLADRRALIETGFPITGDQMVAMPHGPVLSRIYDDIAHGPQQPEAHSWFDFVSAPQNYNVELVQEPPEAGELSDYEIDILKALFEELGHMDKWALVELTHELPEWRDPGGSMIPIEPADILRLQGLPPEEIEAKIAEAEYMYQVAA